MDINKWYKYYSSENYFLLYYLKKIKTGEISIDIHEKKPVNLLAAERLVVPAIELTPLAWYEYYSLENENVLQRIKEIEFGKILIIKKAGKILDMNNYHKIRLQNKNGKNNRKLSLLSSK